MSVINLSEMQKYLKKYTILLIIILIGVELNSAEKKVDCELINLLSNYGFEEGSALSPVDWKFVNVHEATTGKWSDNEGVNGSKCLIIKPQTGLSYGYWQTVYRIPLEASNTYTIGGCHKGSEARIIIKGAAVKYDPQNNVCSRSISPEFSRQYKITESANWKKFAKTFSVPNKFKDKKLWIEIKLMGAGKSLIRFDNIYLIGKAIKLVSPKVPRIVAPAKSIDLELIACDGAGNPVTDIDGWIVRAGNTELKVLSKKFDKNNSQWKVRVKAPEKTGLYDLIIKPVFKGKRKDSFPYEIEKLKFVEVADNVKFFAFAVFSDPHIYSYRKDNKRNRKFLHILTTINNLNPLFALGLGDSCGISNGYDDARVKSMYDGYARIVSTLNCPLYNIAGNHDVDKDDRGVQSRWYYTHYMKYPLYYSFDVANFHFAGIDTNTVGIWKNDHRGSFNLPGQAEWLEKDLSAARKNRKIIVLFFHEPLYGSPYIRDDKWKFLTELIYKNNVKLALEGHSHQNWIITKKNANAKSGDDLQEISVNPDKTGNMTDYIKYLNNPSLTVFEQTTTCSAFISRSSATKYFGFRYIVVKDGKFIFDDSIPESFSIKKLEDSSRAQEIEIVSGPEKSFKQFPLKFDMPPGKYKVLVNNKESKYMSVPGKQHNKLWVFVDIPKKSKTTIKAIIVK